MSAAPRVPPRPRLPVEDVHELARVERLLRADDRATEPLVAVGGNGARVSWKSWHLNEHARGSLTAAVVNEIAAMDAWGVSTIHDPIRRDDTVTSALTVVYAPPADDSA